MTGIMVVDDQPSNRRIIAKLARAVESEIEVTTFGNPLEALAHAADDTPDLLITDYKMAPIDGDEFIRRFRRVPACGEVPVIVITAHDDVEFRDRAIEAGTTDFILSPIDHHEFRTRSREVLALSRRRKLAAGAPDSPGWNEPELIDKAAADAGIEMVSDMMRVINTQLMSTLVELENTRNDLRNLLDISGVAAVFVDGNLLIRRFTPLATSIFRLTESDISRPLTAIATVLAYPGLDGDFRRLIKTQQMVEGAIATRDPSLRYWMRMTPYRRKDGSVDGAALTFTRIGA
jgi:CheY-like chemotaxis protein